MSTIKPIEKAVQFIEQTVSAGAELIAFPEIYISGYPAWIWRLRPVGDWGTSEELHGRVLDSAVDIDACDLKPLCDTAKNNKITIVCGLNERDGELSNATIYNTAVVIGVD